MFKNKASQIIPPPPKFNFPIILEDEYRLKLITDKLKYYDKMEIKGGTTQTNPYKKVYDYALA